MPEKLEEMRKLSTLAEISHFLASSMTFKAALHRVLEILERHHGMIIAAVTLMHEKTEELYLEAVNGISLSNQSLRYLLGENITFRVIESGKPVVVPQISREPMFSHRGRKETDHQEMTFICVPIQLNKK